MSKFRGLIKIITDLFANATAPSMDAQQMDELMNNPNLTDLLDYYINKMNLSNEDELIVTTAKKDCCCNGLIKDVASVYTRVHGYLSLIVCLFGTVANVLNVAVLTRKDMACTPVNRILTGLAVADMMVMIEYVPFAYYYYLVLPRQNDYPYSWAVYLLFHTNFAQVLHTISICLTLALAIWRYIAIRYPEKSHILCTETRCTLAISISYFLPMLLCIPSYLVTSIRLTRISEHGRNYTLYHLDLSDFAKNNTYFYVFCFWTYSVFIKLLPCLILTVISYWLVQALCTAKKRKQILRGYNTCPTLLSTSEEHPRTTSIALPILERRPNKCERRTERTTKMLVAVLLLFLITEFPQGILGLLSGFVGRQFYLQCYRLTGDFMDILALLNGAINFILYCCMSRQFRQTFGQLFKPKILVKWQQHPQSQTEIHTTTNMTTL